MEKLLQNYIARVERDHLPTEGILWAEGENIRFEHRFTPDKPRIIYSHTKSYAATAAGIAIDAGKLHLTDKVIDFFPEHVPDNLDPKWYHVTLQDVLTMSSGANEALLMAANRVKGEGAPDYLKYIFSHPIVKEPGTTFCYSNGDTYIVGRMAEKALGMPMEEILRQHIFLPLGMEEYPTWEHCPMGHAFGASGLELRLSDMCKLGMLYLQKGVWQGRRLLSQSWIDNARKNHISTNPDPKPFDWNNGYGFQCWNLPYGDAYRFDGAYGQFSCILPEKGCVIAVQNAENDVTHLCIQALHEEIISPLYR